MDAGCLSKISEEEALTLSEAELLEIEEDVRLECKRYYCS